MGFVSLCQYDLLEAHGILLKNLLTARSNLKELEARSAEDLVLLGENVRFGAAFVEVTQVGFDELASRVVAEEEGRLGEVLLVRQDEHAFVHAVQKLFVR